MATEINTARELEVSSDLKLFENKVKCLEEVNHILVHNLRGVASNIKMLVEMLLKIYVLNDDESKKKAPVFSLEHGLSLIGDSSAAIFSTLSNLLKGIDTTRSNGIARDQCDVLELVNNTCLQLNGFIQEKKACIRMMLGVTHIEYPRCYLESMLYNFISNALKYSRPEVPLEINISTYHNQSGEIVLSVKDNGLGINLDKYGDRIFNLNQVFHEGHDGKGVGLYITRKQVESLGGNIAVRSKENEGCEFVVTF